MTNMWFAILKSNLKSVFSISSVASENFSTPILFILSIYLGVGGDENLIINFLWSKRNELRHDKTNKMGVHPAKTQISLDIRPVWSKSSLSAWWKLGSLATHWAKADLTGWMPRLIWVFAGRTFILLVLWCCGSNIYSHSIPMSQSQWHCD